jgi:hypothetical protein
MELTEKAEKYAVGKANVAMDKAIAQAYADGYRQGYKDREDEIPVDLRDNKTEFVDLGLPSETMWSVDFEKEDNNRIFLPYGKACEYNIPTKEQWKELQENCKWQNIFEGNRLKAVIFVGPNGNRIMFEVTGIIMAGGYTDVRQIYFWLHDDSDGNNKSAVHLQNGGIIEEMFCGYKLPIRLIRKK